MDNILNLATSGGTDTPTWVIVSAAIGILGFLLSCILGCFEYHRYRIPLQLITREVRVYRSPDRIHFLVLLRICFVNPAAKGRTVGYIQVGKPDNASLSQSPYGFDEDEGTLTYGIPNDADTEVHLSEDEIIWLPLDILPHQSQSGWYALLLRMNEQVQESVIPKTRCLILAEDIFGKTIARYDEDIELKTYTIH